MSRRIFLIRHAEPDFPGGEKYILGRTDMPLGENGRAQAARLGAFMADRPVSRVFASSLSRAAETARAISEEVTVLDGLREMDAGDWDGLPFSVIRAQWAELFEARGRDGRLRIPHSEELSVGQARFAEAMEEALGMTDGDIAIVAHTTVIQSYIARLTDGELDARCAEKTPYCSVYELIQDGERITPTALWLPGEYGEYTARSLG